MIEVELFASTRVVDIHGVLLIVPSDIRYVIVQPGGMVEGYTDQPYYDGEEWQAFDGKYIELAHFTNIEDFSKLWEL